MSLILTRFATFAPMSHRVLYWLYWYFMNISSWAALELVPVHLTLLLILNDAPSQFVLVIAFSYISINVTTMPCCCFNNTKSSLAPESARCHIPLLSFFYTQNFDSFIIQSSSYHIHFSTVTIHVGLVGQILP